MKPFCRAPRRTRIACLALIVATSALACAQPPGTFAAESPQVIPGGRSQDAALAIHDPNEFAWRLFLALNRQAEPGVAGKADPKYSTISDYEPDRPVVWETWALCNGGRAGPIYLPPNESEVCCRVRSVNWPESSDAPAGRHRSTKSI